MRVAICGSTIFTDRLVETKAGLEIIEIMDYAAFISKFFLLYLGKPEGEKEMIALFHTNEKDAIRDFREEIAASDAIPVLNHDGNESRTTSAATRSWSQGSRTSSARTRQEDIPHASHPEDRVLRERDRGAQAGYPVWRPRLVILSEMMP